MRCHIIIIIIIIVVLPTLKFLQILALTLALPLNCPLMPGEINTYQSYQECVALHIAAKPELFMVPDKTRVHANHDLNIFVSSFYRLLPFLLLFMRQHCRLIMN